LTEALRGDQHLGLFIVIPGKDNGFDIEGLAGAGKRLFIGLRGPVLRGWAVILEVELKEDIEQPFTLRLTTIGQILPNYVGNDRAEEAIFTREKIVVPVFELIKVMIEQLPQRRLPRFPAPIYLPPPCRLGPLQSLCVVDKGCAI